MCARLCVSFELILNLHGANLMQLTGSNKRLNIFMSLYSTKFNIREFSIYVCSVCVCARPSVQAALHSFQTKNAKHSFQVTFVFIESLSKSSFAGGGGDGSEMNVRAFVTSENSIITFSES